MTERILITGAAGSIGTAMRPRMAREGRVLRLLDIAPLGEAAPGEELLTGSITDLDGLTAACDGVGAVIHLGGLSTENSWENILTTNIHGSYAVYEAARRAGVPRVVFASSNHAVGFHPNGPAADYLFPRPDTYYGVSKVAGEALGSLYHDRYGLHVVCLRIGSCFPEPYGERMLHTWLSYDDCARLLEASLAAPEPGFRVVWGVSANTRGTWSLDEARALGYQPQDDGEAYADQVQPDAEPELARYLGGKFCSPALDAPVTPPGRPA
ncbi:MAG: NAD-dependent epimerase/dehydratase family protein [Micromonosporaceae bacterium]